MQHLAPLDTTRSGHRERNDVKCQSCKNALTWFPDLESYLCPVCDKLLKSDVVQGLLVLEMRNIDGSIDTTIYTDEVIAPPSKKTP